MARSVLGRALCFLVKIHGMAPNFIKLLHKFYIRVTEQA